eukprot:11158204-Ditylum_brightwellii.AAC.1
MDIEGGIVPIQDKNTNNKSFNKKYDCYLEELFDTEISDDDALVWTNTNNKLMAHEALLLNDVIVVLDKIADNYRNHSLKRKK